MLLKRINTAISVALFLFATLTFASKANEQDQQAIGPSSAKQIARLSSSTKHDVPFLLLMSSNQISVAQFPLIENGCISVVYQLTDSPDINLNFSPENELEEDHDDGTGKVVIADAREYERQMPQSATLGKFGLQQQTTITVAASSKFSTGQEEVTTRNAAEKQGEEGSNQEVKRPRRRSRSSGSDLTDDHGNRRSARSNSVGSSNSIMDGNNNSSSANDVMESSFLNVTSAQFSTRSKEEGKEVLPEEGGADDKNGVSFCDFDLHMAFGYVFVSDSMGRIHRFKLSCYDERKDQTRNDYTNTIDAASKSEGNFSHPTGATERNFASMSRNINDVTASNYEDGAHHNDGNIITDVDAIKASPANTAHRQSGRHPASGSGETVAVLGGVSMENVMVDGLSRTPVLDNPKSGNTYPSQHNIARTLRRSDDSKPQIIWSRRKYGASAIVHSAQQSVEDSSSPHRKGAKSAEGAFPQLSNISQHHGELVAAGGGSNASDDNRLADDASEQHMAGDELQSPEYRDEQDESDQTSASRTATIELQQQRKANNQLQTKVAVDWLNNLLFVLDKYRLLVVDVHGNNELVLIDDFNINNRPVDIKVDPINCFLFWLQVGTFHNTIYKLDLGILSKERHGNTLKLTGQKSRMEKFNDDHSTDSSSELMALISHHYAHPIITNLPHHTKLFTIDHKHSKIYVPLAPTTSGSSADRNKTQRDDAEIFAPPSSDSYLITHLNSTTSNSIALDPSLISNELNDKNCNSSESPSNSIGQILAYNLDGTDVGPLRSDAEKSHLSGMDDMHDITLDSDKGFLYWLTNGGRDLFEEYKTASEPTFFSAQHSLDGKRYLKLKHFDNGSNQPRNQRQRLFLDLQSTTNRQTRSDENRLEPQGMDGRYPSPSIDTDVTRFSRHAPFIILGIICLVVLSVYLIYAFVFQVIGSTSTSTSTFGNERLDSCDIESTSYNTSNAIDEHYRDVINNQTLLSLDTGRLADFGEWPTNMLDMSNKLYVPVEVLQDEALSSIQRISIDQLEIERQKPLGEGHFGQVLQGTITTANISLEQADGDYLTPKSHCSTSTETKIKVAIKKLKSNASVEEKKDFLQEAKLLAKFNHRNIVQLVGICLDRGSTLIVMELMLGGDLIRYMQESHQDNLNYFDLLTICLDIVNGCCYLEQISHIHRDIAARNCLVSSRKREERVVKLADFGLARDIYKNSYYKKLNDSAMPLKWMAPECFREQKFTIMSDVWSFGIVMWEVMTFCKEKPYEGVEPCFMLEYLNQNRLRKPEICSEQIYNLMQSCWHSKPEKRPSFEECRQKIKDCLNSAYI